jgi:hypothetical protein
MKQENTILMEAKIMPRRNDDESYEEQKIGATAGDQEVPPVEAKYGVYNTELVLLSKSSQSRFS